MIPKGQKATKKTQIHPKHLKKGKLLWTGFLGFRVQFKDHLTCGLEELGIKQLALQFIHKCLTN